MPTILTKGLLTDLFDKIFSGFRLLIKGFKQVIFFMLTIAMLGIFVYLLFLRRNEGNLLWRVNGTPER
jgi:hypothetical protein